MAGLCCLRMLLLWVGIIGVVRCQGQPGTPTATPTPPRTLPTPTSVSSNETYISTALSATNATTSTTPSSQTDPQNMTQPALTKPNTTVTTTSQASPPPQCNYTVKTIEFGLHIDITSSDTGNYTININEGGRPVTGKQVITQHFNQSSSYDVTQLKPCTDYEVTFHGAGEEKPCHSTENKIRTTNMREGDMKEVNCSSGHVCYRSEWDISSLQSTPNKVSAEKCLSETFCIKPGYNDICSHFTTTFTPVNCADSSFSLTKSIPVDFLNTHKIYQIPPTKFPAEIKPQLPPNCKNLSWDYTCREHGRVSEPKNLSELEPFTNYSCNSQIKYNNVNIKNTTAVHVRIDCDLTIIDINRRVTNTSIELSWNTTSEKCQDRHLQNLSYNCSCVPNDQKHKKNQTRVSGKTCHITELQPFTDYTCEVKPIYNNKKVAKPTSVKEKTSTGVPQDLTGVNVNVPEHNVISVKCETSNSYKFNGPKKEYIAQIHSGNDLVEKKPSQTKCDFEFRDLSYSTTYTVQVTTFNGKFESKPYRRQVDTLYNDKAVIGFLVFSFIITFVAVAVLIYKIYNKKCRNSRNDVYEDVTLEPLYANVPGWHHKNTCR